MSNTECLQVRDWLKAWFYDETEIDGFLNGKEDVSNKVSSWSATTSNSKYPSEKLVKDGLDGKANVNHNHDDRYYTETEVDDIISDLSDDYAPLNHTHGNITSDGKMSDTPTSAIALELLGVDSSKNVKTFDYVDSSVLKNSLALSNLNVSAQANQQAINTAINSKFGALKEFVIEIVSVTESDLAQKGYDKDTESLFIYLPNERGITFATNKLYVVQFWDDVDDEYEYHTYIYANLPVLGYGLVEIGMDTYSVSRMVDDKLGNAIAYINS